MDVRELPEWALSGVGSTRTLPDFDDGVIPADALDEELRDWSAGVFELRGRRFRLDWLDQEEAGVVHREHGWTTG